MAVIKQTVYDLLKRHCTSEQIAALLKEYRDVDPKQIHVTGVKSELIHGLQEAVGMNLIPEHRVFSLLQRHEENGNQHIFYFKPRNRETATALANGNAIATALLGKDWKDQVPQLNLVPKTTTWSDFRISPATKLSSWIAKAYGHELGWRFVRQEPGEGDQIRKIYEPAEERTVSLIRWRAPDRLEFRVPRSQSRKLLESRLSQLMTMFSDAVAEKDIVPRDLSLAKKRMISEQAEHKAIYHLSDTSYYDENMGVAEFHPQTEDEGLSGDMERAVQIFAEGTGHCRYLRVVWEPIENLMTDPISIFASDRHPHEIVIAARTTPEIVAYVSDQLHSFNVAAS